MASTPRRRRRWIVLLILLGGVAWYVRSRRAEAAAVWPEPRLVPPPSADPVPRAAGEVRPAEPVPAAAATPATGAPATRSAQRAPAPQPIATAPAAPQPTRTAPAAPKPTAPKPPAPKPTANGVTNGAAPNGQAPKPAAGKQPSPRPRPAAAAQTETPARGVPAGGALPGPDGEAPGPEFTIKGNADSMLFHTPESPYYKRTKAEFWFRSADAARAAGFTEWTPKKRP